MKQFGQIIDTFHSQGAFWLTVWDFGADRKWSIPLAEDVDLRVGDIVEYDRSLASELMYLHIVSKESVPSEFRPVVPVADDDYRLSNPVDVHVHQKLRIAG